MCVCGPAQTAVRPAASREVRRSACTWSTIGKNLPSVTCIEAARYFATTIGAILRRPDHRSPVTQAPASVAAFPRLGLRTGGRSSCGTRSRVRTGASGARGLQSCPRGGTSMPQTTPPDYHDRHITFGFRRALVQAGDRVLLVDDWADTGATATAVNSSSATLAPPGSAPPSSSTRPATVGSGGTLTSGRCCTCGTSHTSPDADPLSIRAARHRDWSSPPDGTLSTRHGDSRRASTDRTGDRTHRSPLPR